MWAFATGDESADVQYEAARCVQVTVWPCSHSPLSHVFVATPVTPLGAWPAASKYFPTTATTGSTTERSTSSHPGTSPHHAHRCAAQTCEDTAQLTHPVAWLTTRPRLTYLSYRPPNPNPNPNHIVHRTHLQGAERPLPGDAVRPRLVPRPHARPRLPHHHLGGGRQPRPRQAALPRRRGIRINTCLPIPPRRHSCACVLILTLLLLRSSVGSGRSWRWRAPCCCRKKA